MDNQQITSQQMADYIDSLSFEETAVLGFLVKLPPNPVEIGNIVRQLPLDPDSDDTPTFIKVLLGAEVVDEIVVQEARWAFTNDVLSYNKEAEDGR